MKVPKATKIKSGYRIQLRVGGQSVLCYGTTKAACEAQARARKSELLLSQSGPLPRRSTGAEIDAYIARRSNVLSPSTIRGYRTIRKNFFPRAMRVPLNKVDWQAEINADTHSAKSLRNAWGLVQAVMREQELPVPRVSLPQTISREHPYLTPSEIKTFLSAIEGHPVEVPALLGLHSLRRSEIMALTWENVDLNRGVLYVAGAAVFGPDNKLVFKQTNKNASSRRTVPIMIPRLADVLRAVEDKTGFVVSCNPNTIWAQVNHVCRSAGLPEIGAHGLRHSFASLGYHLGWNELTTQKFGGWADNQTMRKIYTHLAEEDALCAANAMSDFYSDSAQ